MKQQSADGYSAHVEIYLLIGDQRIDVAQVGRGSLILRRDALIEPGTSATLVTRIDGRQETESIVLAQGATQRDVAVPYF